MSKTLCPECQTTYARSVVFLQAVDVLEGELVSFFDSAGLQHLHDPTVQKQKYICSNGHSWENSVSSRCWCGFPSDGRAVRGMPRGLNFDRIMTDLELAKAHNPGKTVYNYSKLTSNVDVFSGPTVQPTTPDAPAAVTPQPPAPQGNDAQPDAGAEPQPEPSAASETPIPSPDDPAAETSEQPSPQPEAVSEETSTESNPTDATQQTSATPAENIPAENSDQPAPETPETPIEDAQPRSLIPKEQPKPAPTSARPKRASSGRRKK